MEIDLDFIKQTGNEISAIIFNDPNQADWGNEIIEEYNKTFEYPPNLLQEIIKYLRSLKDPQCTKYADDACSIVSDPENTENLLNEIFFPSIPEEEEDIESGETEEVYIPEEEEEQPVEKPREDMTPEEYFESIIDKISQSYSLSHDIAYVVLKKLDWDPTRFTREWLKNQKKILSSLRIKIGSSLVKNIKSPLSLKTGVKGECPICGIKGNDIIQLYCGHIICKECLIGDIEQQINNLSLPTCRNDDGEFCGAEIMSHDVEQLLSSDATTVELYHNNLLHSEISLDPNVRQCPHCNWIITPNNSLPCHVGRCPKCCSVVCLKCHYETCHAPLYNCEKVNEFLNQTMEDMRLLEKEQEAWFAREDRLKEHRRSNQKEVEEVFNKELSKLKARQDKQAREEKAKIDELSAQLSELERQVSDLNRQKAKLLADKGSPEDVRIVNTRIEDIREEYAKKDGFRQRLEKDKKVSDIERTVEYESAKNEKELFMSAISDLGMYQRKIIEFEGSLNTRAYQNVAITGTDDDLVSTMTKSCPKCHSPIERNQGCNHMTCQICHYEFCYVCEEPWSTHNSSYYYCPKYKKKVDLKKGKSKCGIDFNDKNDMKFYPPPMNADKISDFMRWNNSYTQYRTNKDKYDRLFKEINNTKDGKPGKNGVVYKETLCLRTKLFNILKKGMNEDEARSRAIKDLNNILFAQLIVMWGYPALYYMIKYPQKARVFEFKINSLDEFKESLLNLIRESLETTTCDDMTVKLDMLENDINFILQESETF